MISDISTFLFLFYLFIFLHEGCHFMAFKLFRVKIKRFYMFPFDFRFNNDIKLKINFRDFSTGLVLPIFNKIEKKEKKIIFVSICSAPFMHLIFLIVGAVAYFKTNSDIYFNLASINLIMILSTMTENNIVVGDLLAAYYILTSNKKAEKIYKGLVEP